MTTNSTISVILQTNSSPISRLSDDLLGDIFSAITDINCHGGVWYSNSFQHDHIPLTITRRASQVCYTWRNILLESPRIWANCIDLDALDQEHHHWRELVLQRTNQSMLTVTGPTPRPGHRSYDALCKFFVNLVQEHWDRIHGCNVSINFFYPLHPVVLQVFSSPAENLKIFIVANYRPFYGLRAGQNYLDSNFPTNFQLFSNHAPSLLQFSILSKWPIVPTSIFSACPCNLRDLEIKQLMALTAVDLTACLQMPLLERLSINLTLNYVDNPRKLHYSIYPSMLQLHDISIDCSDLNIYSVVLDRITTASQCRLRVHHDLPFWNELAGIEILGITGHEAMQRVIKRHGDCEPLSFPLKGNSGCSLTLHDAAFEFICCNGLFEVRMIYKDIHHNLIHDHLSKTLNNISTFKSSSATRRLTIYLSGKFPESLSSGILDVLESMPSIANLEIYPSYLSFHLQCCGNRTLFTSLKILVLSNSLMQPLMDIRYRIIPFLLQQHKISPLEVLNLNENWWPDADLHLLDRISGLRVLWTRDGTTYEYTCGSGSGVGVRVAAC